MVGDVEVTMDVVVKMMVTVVDIGMIMVVVITLVLLEQIVMIVAKGNEMAGEGNVAGGDRGAQHGRGFGRGAYRH